MRDARTLEEAFAYVTDCNLATVSHMAGLKSKSAGEYRRQVNIAQRMCDWMEVFKVDPKQTRAEDIIGKTTVKEWAAKYEP